MKVQLQTQATQHVKFSCLAAPDGLLRRKCASGKLLGGRPDVDEMPPAFISENNIYRDPSSWPPRSRSMPRFASP